MAFHQEKLATHLRVIPIARVESRILRDLATRPMLRADASVAVAFSEVLRDPLLRYARRRRVDDHVL